MVVNLIMIISRGRQGKLPLRVRRVRVPRRKEFPLSRLSARGRNHSWRNLLLRREGGKHALLAGFLSPPFVLKICGPELVLHAGWPVRGQILPRTRRAN